MSNAAIAAALDELADLLEIEGAVSFRVRAYRNAARAVEELPRRVATALAAGEDLTKIPGVGEDLAGKITEVATTGRLAALDEARARVGEGLSALLRVPGLGPKRVATLREKLAVSDLETLATAVAARRVRHLPGFGMALERSIAAALDRMRAPRRFRLDEVEPVAAAIVETLLREGRADRVEVAGSYRRRRETVGDLDVVATGPDAEAIMAVLATLPDVRDVLASGGTRASVVLRSGLQVDVRVVPPESFGAALQYFTGSKAHNIALRRRGQMRGLKVNEYGVFREEERLAGATEAEVYAAVELPPIPAELREDAGEIDAAEAGSLPRLLERADLRGELHAHTTDSDGVHTLAGMVDAARERGLEYLAITDHGPLPRVAGGLDAEGLREQGLRIDAMNAEQADVRVLKGVEVEIHRDGSLDLPDDVLDALDVVVASVHHAFDLGVEEQTARVVRAIESGRVHVLGHPFARRLGEREGIQLDFDRVLDAAARAGVHLELDSQPARLDLPDVAARLAKAKGILVAVDADAHSVEELDFARFGVDQARRGWLGPADVLNARPLDELLRLLR